MSIKFIFMAKSILFRKRIERKYTSNNDLLRVKRIEEIIKIWYRLPGHYHGSENYSVFTPRLEIINYYMEELRKYGWEFVAEEDNVEKSNGKKWKKNIYFLMERMSFNYLFL